MIDQHELTIHSPATGQSSCTCGWEYYVRNFRPQWPLDPKAVDEQVKSAFAMHVRIQGELAKKRVA